MSRESLLRAQEQDCVRDAGSIRAYLPREGEAAELVALNNLLSVVARFGTGVFVIPPLFWEACAQDWWERFEEEIVMLRRADGSYRRVLKGCVVWTAEGVGLPDERVLFQPDGRQDVLAFTVGQFHALKKPEEVYP